jgi:hypothetical protein
MPIIRPTYLQRFLIVLDIVPIDVMMRPDRFPQLWSDDHTRALSGRSTGEEHNPASHVDELRLQKTYSNTEGHTGTSQRTFVISYRPGVLLQLLQGVGELKFTLRYRK